MTEKVCEKRVDEAVRLLRSTDETPDLEEVSSEEEECEDSENNAVSEEDHDDSSHENSLRKHSENPNENKTSNRSPKYERIIESLDRQANSSQQEVDYDSQLKFKSNILDNYNPKCRMHLPDTKDKAKTTRTPLEAWSLLFSNDLLEKIVAHTNEQMERKLPTLSRQTYYRETNITEIRAFIGLLYLSGVQKSSKTNLEELWSNEFDSNLFRSVMSLHRFLSLESCIRFDDKNTRTARRETDKLAAIREVWKMFINNCTKYYSPSQNCTIGEQFLAFKGKCPFKIHMKGKFDGYGMKILMLNDSKTFYMLNAIPHVGRSVKKFTESIMATDFYIETLTSPIHKTNRNITCDDKWFIGSAEMCDEALIEKYGLTLIGAIRKNKGQIATSSDKKTPLIYTTKNNKLTIVSTLHHSERADNVIKKSDVISLYNETKGATDIFDQLCRTYTTAKKTNRWSTRFFYGMLDQAGVNANIIYNLNFDNERMDRRSFLKGLGLSLITPQLRFRLTVPSLPKHLRVIVENILGERQGLETKTYKLLKRKRCYFCPSKDDRKTSYCCFECGKPICDVHRKCVCNECAT